MYSQNTEVFLTAIAISTLIMTLFIFLSGYIMTCFEMPGQTGIPQDKWRAENA
jgi:fucose 4-O-acetylase-like acetyltransferase